MVADLCSIKYLLNLKCNCPHSFHYGQLHDCGIFRSQSFGGVSESSGFVLSHFLSFFFFLKHNFHPLLYRKPFCSLWNGVGGVVPGMTEA